MNQLAVVHRVAGVLHIDAVGKEPKLATPYLVIVEMSAGWCHCSMLRLGYSSSNGSAPRKRSKSL